MEQALDSLADLPSSLCLSILSYNVLTFHVLTQNSNEMTMIVITKKKIMTMKLMIRIMIKRIIRVTFKEKDDNESKN